jgi:NAD(P)-dependent dehydrogenase (short-subunit alcohol dehydrogenase family)
MLNRFTGGPGTDFFNQMANMHPVGRLGRPEEMAEAVVWLCSEKASFVTGVSLTADGGFTAQ